METRRKNMLRSIRLENLKPFGQWTIIPCAHYSGEVVPVVLGEG